MQGGKRPIFYGYAIVAAAFVLSFASGPGQSFAFSVFQPAILAGTGLNRHPLFPHPRLRPS